MLAYHRPAEKHTWVKLETEEALRNREQAQAEQDQYDDAAFWDWMDSSTALEYWRDEERRDEERRDEERAYDYMDDRREVEEAWEIYDEYLRPPGAWGKSGEPSDPVQAFLWAIDRKTA